MYKRQLSGATPAEAVSWGKVNPGVLPDTVVAYCDSTIAFPLFCEYAIGSPKNFYLQAQPTLWEVYNIPKGGNDYFIQFTTDQVVWGGLSGATPAEAVSWGKVNPGVLPDTVVCYCDSTVAFPLFAEYAVGSKWNRRERRGLVHQREALVTSLKRQAEEARNNPRPHGDGAAPPAIERHR